MPLRRITTLILLGTLLLPVASCGEDPAGPTDGKCYPDLTPGDDGLAILFIGNSLTYWFDVGGILAGLFHQAGVPFDRIETLAKPNYGLVDHWLRPEARAAIAEGWDVVVLQQGPSATVGRASLLHFTGLFAEEIRAAGGVPALYMVWPSAERILDFDGVSDSYATAAEQVDGLLLPAGEAWRAAWARDPDLQLYDDDGLHPNPLGAYLAAAVMFEQFSGLAPETLSGEFCVPGMLQGDLPDSTAATLHAAAAEANERFARTPAARR